MIDLFDPPGPDQDPASPFDWPKPKLWLSLLAVFLPTLFIAAAMAWDKLRAAVDYCL